MPQLSRGACRLVSFSPRLQTCIAVSCSGSAWMLIGASPDLRQQITAASFLHPRPEHGRRSSPIEAVVLTNGEVDSIAGLLSLREGFAFDLLAFPSILEAIAASPIFNVLAPARVRRVPLTIGRKHHAAGLDIEAFPVPGKVALYDEQRATTAHR